jgi:uncharacterized membrane protein YhaH (DUF805 family)
MRPHDIDRMGWLFLLVTLASIGAGIAIAE